jgi:hypothetical protein
MNEGHGPRPLRPRTKITTDQSPGGRYWSAPNCFFGEPIRSMSQHVIPDFPALMVDHGLDHFFIFNDWPQL